MGSDIIIGLVSVSITVVRFVKHMHVFLKTILLFQSGEPHCFEFQVNILASLV